MTTTTTTTTKSANGPLSLILGNGQKIHFQSDTSIEADEIPVIDISAIFTGDLEARKVVAEQVREACHRIGFFYIVNHGIDQTHVDHTFEQGNRFFNQSMDKKLEICTDLVPDEYFGYFPLSRYNRNGKLKNDLMEAYNWGYHPAHDPESSTTATPDEPQHKLLWPRDLPNFKETVYSHYTQLLTLSRRLTRTFALALHLPEDHFDAYIRQPEAAMRITHYPQQTARPSDQLGIGAHTDFECFTLLTQDMNGGLEVLSKSGYWIKAKPIPGSIVVNIADCFMRQTNDYFVSTVHRVVNQSGNERYSCPFFFGFNKEMRLEPVETCVSEDNPMKYPVMSTLEYLRFRRGQAKGTANEAEIESTEGVDVR